MINVLVWYGIVEFNVPLDDKRLGTHTIFEGLRERTEYVPQL